MTRAIERLIVCGVDRAARRLPEGCWYDLVRDALEAGSALGAGRRRRRRGAALSQDARRPARQKPSRRARRRPFYGPARLAHAADRQPDRRARARRSGRPWRRRRRRRHSRRAATRQGAAARHAHAPAAAIAAGHSRAARAARRRRNSSRATAPDFSDDERAEIAEQVCVVLERSALRRAVRARQPRRGPDRRPADHRQAKPCACPARSTGWWSPANRADRRLQDRGAPRVAKEAPRGLRRAARPLPRGAAELYPGRPSAPP